MTSPQLPVLRGLIVPLVTPLSGYNKLDAEGLERLVEHVLAGGVHGLFLLGTTGEGPGLSYKLRREMIERTCRQAGLRVPVLVCISDTSLAESLRVAGWAADAGACAVVAAPPYYFPASQPELQLYFERLAAACPLPLLLYNMPATTKIAIEPDTVWQAMDHPRIVGLKDSSGSMAYLHQVLAFCGQRADWRVFVGDEEMLAYAVQAGADGGVNGGANVFPELFVQFYEAAAAGDLARCETLRGLVVRLGELYGGAPACGSRNRIASGIKGIKCALSLMGVCGEAVAPPLLRLQEAERVRIGQILEELSAAIETAATQRVPHCPTMAPQD